MGYASLNHLKGEKYMVSFQGEHRKAQWHIDTGCVQHVRWVKGKLTPRAFEWNMLF